MGNRAVITTSRSTDPQHDSSSIGVYLHWNGGPTSVKSFLDYRKMKGYRIPDIDCYGWSYLCGVITNFFGDGCSCGINTCNNLDCDNWDNGTYIIDGWDIVGHKYSDPGSDPYDELEFLFDIDDHMPRHMQLGHDKIMEIWNEWDTPFTPGEEI